MKPVAVKTATDTITVSSVETRVYVQIDIANRRLTPTQARRLARALLAHADKIDAALAAVGHR